MDRNSTTSSNPRLREFGPWTEQYSSSGKRYFYNRETEVSQWEKPHEWKEYEKTLTDNANHSPISSSSGIRTGVHQQQHAQHHNPNQNQHTAFQNDASASANVDESKHLRKQKTPYRESQQPTAGSSQNRQQKPEVNEDDPIGPVVFSEEQHLRYFRPDLIAHLRHWPSEEYEQAAWRAQNAAHNLSLQISNVSCDIKCARSLVKTAEMRSSLLTQKLLFLGEQQRQLEANPAMVTPLPIPSTSNL
ncbi:hypothetical protein AB6A40_006870 [Gnathostoma spinigerum]|uniref:WW domain-containing protein n=1 Tax=Gnathostoma spinigerum TaxID=75299 RepID=A0ABD6ELM8_9BILA